MTTPSTREEMEKAANNFALHSKTLSQFEDDIFVIERDAFLAGHQSRNEEVEKLRFDVEHARKNRDAAIEANQKLAEASRVEVERLRDALRELYTYPGVRNLLAPLDSLGSIAAIVEQALGTYETPPAQGGGKECEHQWTSGTEVFGNGTTRTEWFCKKCFEPSEGER